MDEKTLVHKFVGHTDILLSGYITKDDRFLVTGSFDKTIRVWDINQRVETQKIEPKAGKIYRIAFSYDETFLAFSDEKFSIKL